MAKRMSLFDEATRDFLPYSHMTKVEREKDRPWISEQAITFLTRKGVVKEEGGKLVVQLGTGWFIQGKVGTRPGRYLNPMATEGAETSAAAPAPAPAPAKAAPAAAPAPAPAKAEKAPPAEEPKKAPAKSKAKADKVPAVEEEKPKKAARAKAPAEEKKPAAKKAKAEGEGARKKKS